MSKTYKTPRSQFIALCTHSKTVRFQSWWCPAWTERRILEVKSAQVGIESPKKPGTPSWLQFPKADCIVRESLIRGAFRVKDAPDSEARFDLCYQFSREDCEALGIPY